MPRRGHPFVLHVFQKKSKSGIATAKPDMELIETRLKRAAEVSEEMKRELKKSERQT
jgi:phage-related protein